MFWPFDPSCVFQRMKETTIFHFHRKAMRQTWKVRYLGRYTFRCLSTVSVCLTFFLLIPTAACIVRVAVGLSEAFKLCFPLSLVPGGGQTVVARGGVAQHGSPQTPQIHTFHLTHRIERTQSWQLPDFSLYIYCNPGQLCSAVFLCEGCLRAKLEVMKATLS